MERQVEIEREYAVCKSCMDYAEMCGETPKCEICPKLTGIWIDTISNFWGTYALVVLEGGNVEKIPLHRIKVIGGQNGRN